MRPRKTSLRVTPDESSPIAESTSKWKIPHYYKKSSSMTQTVISDISPAASRSSQQQQQQNVTYSPTMALNGGNNRINIMSTPVAVQLEDPDQPKTRKGQKAKAKKNGSMVFVNFTVQDTAESPKKSKQSRREKMLRIFKGTENIKFPAATTLPLPAQGGRELNVLEPAPVMEPKSAPPSTPNSASKRSCSSSSYIVKSGKVGGSAISSAGSTSGKYSRESSIHHQHQHQIIGMGVHTAPSGEDPLTRRSNSMTTATSSSSRLSSRTQLSRSMLSSHAEYSNVLSPVLSNNSNMAMQQQLPPHPPTPLPLPLQAQLQPQNSKIDLLKKRFLQTATNLHSETASYNDYTTALSQPTASLVTDGKNNKNNKFTVSVGDNDFQGHKNMYNYYNNDDEHRDTDPSNNNCWEPYNKDYEEFMTTTFYNGSLSKPNLHRSNTFSVNHYHADENDASIAFSKMFTRKRANTGGSISPLVSNSQTLSPYYLPGNMSTNSIQSQRYSPIRSHSPARTRSNTRGSSSHRLPRDMSSVYMASTNNATTTNHNHNYNHNNNSNSNSNSNNDEDDNNTIPRSDSVVGIGTYLDNNTIKPKYTHKFKQDSISDILRSSAHQFPSGMATGSSISHSSTPGISDLNGPTSAIVSIDTNGVWSLDRDTSFATELYDEKHVQAAKVIPATAIDESDEAGLDLGSIPNTSNSSRGIEPSLEPSVPTSGLSYQYIHDHQGFTLVNTGLGSTASNLSKQKNKKQQKGETPLHVNNYIPNSRSEPYQNGLINNEGSNILDSYMDFDLENALNMFSSENGTIQIDLPADKNNCNSSTIHGEIPNVAVMDVSATTLTGGDISPQDGKAANHHVQAQQSQQPFLHSRALPHSRAFSDLDQFQVRGDFYAFMDNKDLDNNPVMH